MGDKTVLDVVFILRLKRFLRYDDVTRKHDEARVQILIDKLGVSIRSIQSWVTGRASPPPMKKKEVEEFLNSWVEPPETKA